MPLRPIRVTVPGTELDAAALNFLLRTLASIILLVPSLLVSRAAQSLVDSNYFLLFIPLLIGEFFVTIFCHELGHAAAARLFGWRIDLFAVTPIAYRVKTGRFEFWSRFGADFGGLVVCQPDPATATPARLGFLSFAGPLASFVLAALLLAASAISPWAFGRTVLGSTGAVSFFFGLGNLIPFRTRKGFRSDGMGVIQALLGKRARKKPSAAPVI